MKRAPLLAVAVALVLAGCGDDSSSETTTTATETTEIRVYFLRDGKVWPVPRELAAADAEAAALDELLAGPSELEAAELGAETAIPEAGDVSIERLEISDGVATYDPPVDLGDRAALAQVVYTLTQFPHVESVVIDGESYVRADFEDETPSVLVESPLPFEQIETPLRVTGTANTFEANFQYELLDSDRNVVDENFVTATSGTGTRGTFDFTTDAVDDLATLVVFESSAEDGSRIHEVEIPLDPAP